MTRFTTAEDKASFANKLCRFIAADFKESLFTKNLYDRLAGSFGLIAHGDRNGFYVPFFRDLVGKAASLDQTVRWIPRGDPAWTHSDVERAVIGRPKAARLLDAHRALRAAEIEGAERELLRRLAAKYGANAPPMPPPTPPPVLHCPAPARRNTPAPRPPEQHSLF